MWALYTFTTIGFLSTVMNLFYRKFFPLKMKTFEDVYENDNYKLLCYTILFEDGSKMKRTELKEYEIKEIDESNKIKYIEIEYMFNGKYMRYITYEKDITFPIYVFNVTEPKFPYYPESIFLNEIDVTEYITPYLGPLCNFYNDRHAPIKLEDTLRDHPNFNNFNFEEGRLIFISNKTPLNGKKCFVKELPCNLIWKRHAAVDPRDEDKLKDFHYVN